METIVTSLITQLKNPWQYICFAIAWFCILYFKINSDYLLPASILSLPCGYFLSNVSQYVVFKYRQKQKEKDILFHLNHLNPYEREFIKQCINDNTQTRLVDIFRGGIVSSLQSKLIAFVPRGTNDVRTIPLTIPNNVWKLIQKNRKLYSCKNKVG